MRNILALALLFWVQVAPAQNKISPRARRQGGMAWLVELRPDVPAERVRARVQELGFDPLSHPDLRPNHLLVVGSRAALDRLAGLAEVAHILPASADLLAGRRVLACGGAIGPGAAGIGEYSEASPGWAKDGSGAVALQYFFESVTDKLDESQVRGEIERAFREWQKYGNVTIAAGTGAGAARAIDILFARRSHGDPYPFDGPGGVLAHTFYPAPPNQEPVAGDMHFDADENWSPAGIDLFSVALHEAGHALGLGHSDDPNAVMYPYYRVSSGLTSDDIAGIQALYGAAGSTPPGGGSGTTPSGGGSTPSKPSSPSNPPNPPAGPGTPPSNPTPTPSGSGSAPGIQITAPVTTIVATTAATLSVSGTATGSVAAVRWSTSNGDAGTANGTAAWSASVPLLVGNTVVTVRAYDAAGNSSWRAITVVRH